MTYRDDTESVRAENERLRAENAALRSGGVITRGRSTPLEAWEHFAMPVVVCGAPIATVACAAAYYGPRAAVSLPIAVVLWWVWAAWRMSK